MRIEINLSNKAFYTLLALTGILLLAISVLAYNSNMQSGEPDIMGHSAGEINIEINGQVMSLQDAIDTGKFSSAGEYHEAKGPTNSGLRIQGLISGKKYLVHVYGNIRSDGSEIQPVGVKECDGEILSQTPPARVNWPDGGAPQSASFLITAPSSGCIEGFTDLKEVYMNAVSLG
jgi:hypothetical protein